MRHDDEVTALCQLRHDLSTELFALALSPAPLPEQRSRRQREARGWLAIVAKRLDTLRSGAALAVLAVTLSALSARAVCGDVNGDGVVDIADALLVAQCDVGLRSCDFPLATACNGPTTTTTTTVPAMYTSAAPQIDGCPDVCAFLQWSTVCDGSAGPCPQEPVVAIDRSLDGLTGWTTVLAASAPGQTSYLDSALLPQTVYYYRVRVLP